MRNAHLNEKDFASELFIYKAQTTEQLCETEKGEKYAMLYFSSRAARRHSFS